jgi:hypothetical protein
MHRYALLPLLLLLLLVALVAGTTIFAVDDKAAQYIGGTVVGLREKAEGTLVVTDEMLAFDAKTAGSVEILYASITSLEYGEKPVRRVATLTSPRLLPPMPEHYLTISYSDADGTAQSAVFGLAPESVRTSMKIIEARSGEPIAYQDDGAREWAIGGR